MGYRLCVDMVGHESPSFYGTKLYGYVDNEKQLKSYQWLLEKGFLSKNKTYIWTYCCENPIHMTVKDFKEFAVLYDKDCEETGYPPNSFLEDSSIKEILNLEDDELLVLSWG